MKICAILPTLFLCAVPLLGQQSSPGTPLHGAPASSRHNPGDPTATVTTLPAISPNQEKLEDLTQRVRLLELQMAQQSGKSQSDYSVAIIGAAAVFGAALVAALLGIAGQLLAARHTARLAREAALHKDAEKTIEFRTKQVQEFHAPLSALLRQSKDLYDKMLEQLVEDDPTRYRKVPTATGNEFRWEVFDKDGQWRGFRLLDQFPVVKKDPKALALADANLVIGQNICQIVSTHAGYASEGLVDMLGQYLGAPRNPYHNPQWV